MNTTCGNDGIRKQCIALHLPYIRENLNDLLMEAQQSDWSYSEFLEAALTIELDGRNRRAQEKRMKEAGFPYAKTLDEFDLNFCTAISRPQFHQLKELTWVDGLYNLILSGPPGTGKTHLAIALGRKACEDGYRVSYCTMQTLMRILRTQEIDRMSKTKLNRIKKSQLVIVDEVGYLPVGKSEGNLFFELISELQEQCSILITTNKGFEEWTELLGDPKMAAATLDRLSFRCDKIEMGGKSYRIENHSSFLDKDNDAELPGETG